MLLSCFTREEHIPSFAHRMGLGMGSVVRAQNMRAVLAGEKVGTRLEQYGSEEMRKELKYRPCFSGMLWDMYMS